MRLNYHRWSANDLQTELDPHPEALIDLINGWLELTGVLNELSRGMGLADFYPFVLNRAALRKLHLVHCVVKIEAQTALDGTGVGNPSPGEFGGQQTSG